MSAFAIIAILAAALLYYWSSIKNAFNVVQFRLAIMSAIVSEMIASTNESMRKLREGRGNEPPDVG